MNEWFAQHPWITYLIIFVLVAFIYNKVFRVRKLPLLKDLIVYLIMAVGSFLLLIFQIDGLPIVPSMGVAVLLMAVVRVRYWVTERSRKKPE